MTKSPPASTALPTTSISPDGHLEAIRLLDEDTKAWDLYDKPRSVNPDGRVNPDWAKLKDMATLPIQ